MPTSNTARSAGVSCVRARNDVVLWLTCLLLVLASQAKADLMSFSDRTAWENASTGLTVLSFAGLGGGGAPGDPTFPDKNYPSGLTLDGVTFVGSNGYLIVRTQLGAPANTLYGPPDGSLGCPPPAAGPCGQPHAGITVTMPGDVGSVGWDFGNFYVAGVTVHFLNGATFSESAFSGFVGFTSTDPITSLDIHSAGYPTVENFAFGSTIPEPSSVLLLVTVIAGVGASLRSRRPRLR